MHEDRGPAPRSLRELTCADSSRISTGLPALRPLEASSLPTEALPGMDARRHTSLRRVPCHGPPSAEPRRGASGRLPRLKPNPSCDSHLPKQMFSALKGTFSCNAPSQSGSPENGGRRRLRDYGGREAPASAACEPGPRGQHGGFQAELRAGGDRCPSWKRGRQRARIPYFSVFCSGLRGLGTNFFSIAFNAPPSGASDASRTVTFISRGFAEFTDQL